LKVHFFIQHAIEKACPQQTAVTLKIMLATFMNDIPMIETKPHRKIDKDTTARNIFFFLTTVLQGTQTTETVGRKVRKRLKINN
jgi:hypothetical protein